MKLIPLKKIMEYKPPFRETCADLTEWLKPVTVICKGKNNCVAGGMLISSNVIATTAFIEGETVKVWLPNGKCNYGKRIITAPQHAAVFLSFFLLTEDQPWLGLPTWGQDGDDDFNFFSYIPGKKERMILYEHIEIKRSKSALHSKERRKTELENSVFTNTFPIVDQYGYFVGLGIGTSYGECIVLNFSLKNSLI